MRVNTKKKNRWNPSGGQMSALKKGAGNIFFDYNTVESVLLFCAILVAIAGIMFTSGQLSVDGNSADSAVSACLVSPLRVMPVCSLFLSPACPLPCVH
jgi:hypothetical protein